MIGGSMLILVKVFQNCGVNLGKANEMQIKMGASSVVLQITSPEIVIKMLSRKLKAQIMFLKTKTHSEA